MKVYDNLIVSNDKLSIAKHYNIPVSQVTECGEDYYTVGFYNGIGFRFKLVMIDRDNNIKELIIDDEEFMFPEIIQTMCNSVDKWKMNVYDRDTYCTIYKYTPLGEDYSFCLHLKRGKESYSANDFINALEGYYESFDVDEEVTSWVDNRGKNGVPESIEDLLDNTKWKKQWLSKLITDLHKDVDENSPCLEF